MAGFLDYIQIDPEMVTFREHLIDIFAYIQERPVYPDPPMVENGIVFAEKPKSKDKARYGYYRDGEFIKLDKSKNSTGGPFSQFDVIEVDKNVIANGPSRKIKSDIGHFILNQTCFAGVTGDLIPYVNHLARNLKPYEEDMADAILDGKCTNSQYYDYVKRGIALTHFGDLFVPTITVRGSTVDEKILKRRDELIKQHGDKINDPKVAAAMKDELVAMYVEYMKGDPGFRYYDVRKKSFEAHAMRMFIMIGGISDYGSTNTVTIPRSLSEGLKPEDMAASCNDARKGAAGRGIETQVGGANANLVSRAYQDTVIDKDDCGTSRTLTVTFSEDVPPKNFVGRYIVNRGNLKEITKADVPGLMGKTVQLRSPMYCEAENLCYTCMGATIKKLGITNPGVLEISIPNTNMQQRMKAMHIEVLTMKQLSWRKFLK